MPPTPNSSGSINALTESLNTTLLNNLAYEEHIQTAITDIRCHAKSGLELSVHAAAKKHNVSRSTLQDRYNGCLTQVESHDHQQKLMPPQEEILVKWIKEQVRY